MLVSDRAFDADHGIGAPQRQHHFHAVPKDVHVLIMMLGFS